MDYLERFLTGEVKKRGRGLKVGFFGLGKTNTALIKRTRPYADEITVRSDAPISESEISELKPTKILTKDKAYTDIDEDLLFLSPSVKRDKKELKEAKNTLISSDCELYFTYRDKSRPLLAVSGSDGKSTVTHLASLMLNESKIESKAVCNFGTPFCEMGECTPVAELSSFNLKYLVGDCDRAAITNITPNHLDWHGTFEDYRDCKLKLVKMSRELVYNYDCDIMKQVLCEAGEVYAVISQKSSFDELKRVSKASLYYTVEDGYVKQNGERLVALSELGQKEAHNIMNFITASALTDGYADKEAMIRVGKSFTGLEHRCKSLGVIKGVEYVDSSIDTSPERTAKTLTSLDRRVIIILGGRGKGLPFSPLIPVLKKYALRVMLYGELGKELVEVLKESGIGYEYNAIFADAVKCAISVANKGDTVLLSPAGTAYDQFKNFEHRAEAFWLLINQFS